MSDLAQLEQTYGSQNYAPLPVILAKGEGVYLWDDKGNRYLDMMSAYSAVSHGHCHPRLVKALTQQASQLAMVSRAFYTQNLGPFLKLICEATGYEKGLAMNSGAEAVETALKVARKWAYTKKGVPDNKAEIITAQGNFHGRTISITNMSSEPAYRAHFGPYDAGSVIVPYGDIDALKKAINFNTAAFLVEPIQGENGIVMPPEGYLKAAYDLCCEQNVLMICDEIQTGMGRTGKLLASQHAGFKPHCTTLGKALGGGLLPVSMFLASSDVMDVLQPGDHGSTFGGNPLACAVGIEAINVLYDEKLMENSEKLGHYFLDKLKQFNSPYIKDVRGLGLFIGIEVQKIPAREICQKLLDKGLLSKDTHGTVIRLAPPLVINQQQVDDALGILAKVLCS